MTRHQIIIDAIVVINDTQSLMETPEFAKVNREDVVEIHKQIRQLKDLVYNKIKDNLPEQTVLVKNKKEVAL